MIRKLSLIAIALLALPLTGCWELDLFSWSPDGRYLVFVDPNEGVAWRWDTVKQRAERVRGLDGAEIGMFSFVSNHEAIVFGDGFKNSGLFSQDLQGLVKLNMADGYMHEVPAGEETGGFTVSRDGKQIVTIGFEGEDENRRAVVAIALTNDVNKRRELASFGVDILMPHLDDSGTRLLLVKEIPSDDLPEDVEEGAELVLIEFDSDSATTTTLLKTFDEFPINPRWIDSDSFVYTLFRDDGDNENTGKLMLKSLDQDEPELLHDLSVGFFPPSVSPDGNTLVFTTALVAETEMEHFMQSAVQLLAIDIKTREKTVLTNEEFGAYAGTFSPTKNQLAYATGEDRFSVRILDLDTGKVQMVWRDDEERIFAGAERFNDAGGTGLALAGYEELLRRFPESDFRMRALYRKMQLHLGSSIDEFDEAVAAFSMLKHSSLGTQARPLLWARPDATALDLSADLIRKYKTEASQAEFGFDTDRTRDLTSLAVRWTPTRLYLAIDFDSPYDLGGSVFQDLILLFHEVGNDDGVREITPSVNWEYAAALTVVIRHWHEVGQVYDLEIRNNKGDVTARYAGSGFAPPSFPLFEVFDDAGTFMCSLDYRALGLRPESDYYLQVCTVKGGIESYKGVERPREETGWDIADAFGESNTKDRIDADIAAGTEPILQGYATTLRLPKDNDQ